MSFSRCTLQVHTLNCKQSTERKSDVDHPFKYDVLVDGERKEVDTIIANKDGFIYTYDRHISPVRKICRSESRVRWLSDNIRGSRPVSDSVSQTPTVSRQRRIRVECAISSKLDTIRGRADDSESYRSGRAHRGASFQQV